jgi:hypothetical protein
MAGHSWEKDQFQSDFGLCERDQVHSQVSPQLRSLLLSLSIFFFMKGGGAVRIISR